MQAGLHESVWFLICVRLSSKRLVMPRDVVEPKMNPVMGDHRLRNKADLGLKGLFARLD